MSFVVSDIIFIIHISMLRHCCPILRTMQSIEFNIRRIEQSFILMLTGMLWYDTASSLYATDMCSKCVSYYREVFQYSYMSKNIMPTVLTTLLFCRSILR